MVDTHPLILRDLKAPIAFLTKSIRNFGLAAGQVDTRTFLSHVNAVAAALDEGKHAINLCHNRYLFMVSFCAAILRGHTNLLPPNKNTVTQKQLADTYEDSYIIHDGVDVDCSIRRVDLFALQLGGNLTAISDIPNIPDEHLACISFTSGSTGNSKPNLKYWRTLYRSSAINYHHMIPETVDTIFQLATMPAQHMWGLETSVLLPLFQRICMSDAQPLFPQDILDTLKTLPTPTLLASTPVHLRALTINNTDRLSLFAVLCATSPLTTALAKKIESQFSCSLREVYGCSEVGSIAVRRTAKEQKWLRFEGIHFEKDGDNTIASAAHLPEPTVLQDHIEYCGEQHFTLSGRTSDLVNIAGKRGSLFEITHLLLCFEGLKDGVVLQPESHGAPSVRATTRLCAIVALKDGFDKSMLSIFLRKYLDNAFVPRPIYVVDSLPRESNGKLLKSNINSLLESLRS